MPELAEVYDEWVSHRDAMSINNIWVMSIIIYWSLNPMYAESEYQIDAFGNLEMFRTFPDNLDHLNI